MECVDLIRGLCIQNEYVMFPFYRVMMLPDNYRLLLLVDSFFVVTYFSHVM